MGIFVQDLAFAENDYSGKMFANNELPNQEINLDVSFDLDIPLENTNKELSPLDQLCLDLAPFNQKTNDKDKDKKDTSSSDSSLLPGSDILPKFYPKVPHTQSSN